MHVDELLTKGDLERFKEKLFEQLKKIDPSQHQGIATKEWLKSCEVRTKSGKIMGIDDQIEGGDLAYPFNTGNEIKSEFQLWAAV